MYVRRNSSVEAIPAVSVDTVASPVWVNMRNVVLWPLTAVVGEWQRLLFLG